jgi:hypothetical protein
MLLSLFVGVGNVHGSDGEPGEPVEPVKFVKSITVKPDSANTICKHSLSLLFGLGGCLIRYSAREFLEYIPAIANNDYAQSIFNFVDYYDKSIISIFYLCLNAGISYIKDNNDIENNDEISVDNNRFKDNFINPLKWRNSFLIGMFTTSLCLSI